MLVERPLLLGRLHRLQVTLVEKVEDAVLLLDVRRHDEVAKLLDVARIAVPDRGLLLVQHAHSIQVAQAEPCVRVSAGFDLPVQPGQRSRRVSSVLGGTVTS
ncbi:MAG: hypothetical protein IH988_06175 [Planctomycetes bacterium]|nr:hypothetical protein [Planctomycetota bacterium]